MWGWVIILTRWVRPYWDSILLHGLHAIISSASCSRVNLRRPLTSTNLSLLSSILEGSSCSDLTWSVLLLSTCPYCLLARLSLIYLIEWTHWSLTLGVVIILTEKSIQILRSCTWSSALWRNSLDLTLFIREFSSTTWLLTAASTSWLEKTTLSIISSIKKGGTTKEILSLNLLRIMETLLHFLSRVWVSWLNIINHVEHILHVLWLILRLVHLVFIVCIVVHQLYWARSVEELRLVWRFWGKLGTDYLIWIAAIFLASLLHDSIGKNLAVEEGEIILTCVGETLIVYGTIGGELIHKMLVSYLACK